MASRRRRRKSVGKVITDVESRVRRVEKRPGATRLKNNVVTTQKLQYRAIKTKTIATDAVTPNEVDFGVTFVTDTQPTDFLKEGTTWVDPNTGAAAIYDPGVEDFIDLTAVDAVARTTADGKNTIYAQTTAPSGTGLKTNDIWYDTDDGNKLYVWSGTTWLNIQDTAIAAAANAAQAAQSTADGKNKVYRQTAEPTGGTYVSGDLWFDTDDNNKIYRYSGTAWVAVQLGGNALANINANAITAGSIDASVITVSNINAGNISTGTLAAARIAANSLDVNVLQAGTLRAGTVYTGDIVASQITAGTISAAVEMTSATITGGLIRQAVSGTRIEMNSASPGTISFYSTATNPGKVEIATDPGSGVNSVIITPPNTSGNPGYISLYENGGATSLVLKANVGILSTASTGFSYINDVSVVLANLKMIAASTVLPSASAYYNGTVFLVYT